MGMYLNMMVKFTGDHQIGQLHQQLVHGHQHAGGSHIEAGMDHGDVPCRAGVIQEGPVDKEAQTVEHDDEDGHAHHVEQQVDHGRSPGVAVGTDGTHHCCDTGTDVLTKNNRDRCAIGHSAGDTQTLQDTYGCGGGLDDGGQSRTEQNTDNGRRTSWW